MIRSRASSTKRSSSLFTTTTPRGPLQASIRPDMKRPGRALTLPGAYCHATRHLLGEIVTEAIIAAGETGRLAGIARSKRRIERRRHARWREACHRAQFPRRYSDCEASPETHRRVPGPAVSRCFSTSPSKMSAASRRATKVRSRRTDSALVPGIRQVAKTKKRGPTPKSASKTASQRNRPTADLRGS